MTPRASRASGAATAVHPGRQVRTLVVSDDPAWPADSGGRQRLQHILRGLQEAGPVHWVTVVPRDQLVGPPPRGLTDRADVLVAPPLDRGQTARRWLTGSSPKDVAARDWRSARALLPTLTTGGYDLVWFERPEVYAALDAVAPAGPRVLDLDNVMSVLTMRMAWTMSTRWKLPLHAVDAIRWRRLEQQATRACQAVLVCSERDRRRLGGTSRVVPNGYEMPPEPRPTLADRGMVLLLVASLHWPPNASGAVWFAHEVLPLVRQQVPGATLRIVGTSGDRLDVPALAALPGVEVVGYVEDVLEQLDDSAVVVVPLKAGGGTRVKVLEAFAAGVPVVSTRIGCEGIEAAPGRDLLVADDPRGFASACIRLLTDRAEAQQISQSARQVYLAKYQWAMLRSLVTEVARQAAAARVPV